MICHGVPSYALWCEQQLLKKAAFISIACAAQGPVSSPDWMLSELESGQSGDLKSLILLILLDWDSGWECWKTGPNWDSGHVCIRMHGSVNVCGKIRQLGSEIGHVRDT